jgi:hypothetical protein
MQVHRTIEMSRTGDLHIWQLLFTSSRGWQWVDCRSCHPDNAEKWLAIFRADEPHKVFTLSSRRPKLPKEFPRDQFGHIKHIAFTPGNDSAFPGSDYAKSLESAK